MRIEALPGLRGQQTDMYRDENRRLGRRAARLVGGKGRFETATYNRRPIENGPVC